MLVVRQDSSVLLEERVYLIVHLKSLEITLDKSDVILACHVSKY